MKTLEHWLSEYDQSHRNPVNKLIHYICVPAIFWSICSLLFSVKLPFEMNGYRPGLAEPALLLVSVYYFRLSLKLLPGFWLFCIFCLWSCQQLEVQQINTAVTGVVVFVLAWIGQFYGHHLEGKRPSFLNDLRFLLIGPAWILLGLYKKAGISF